MPPEGAKLASKPQLIVPKSGWHCVTKQLGAVVASEAILADQLTLNCHLAPARLSDQKPLYQHSFN
jgi:hypothetical protein